VAGKKKKKKKKAAQILNRAASKDLSINDKKE